MFYPSYALKITMFLTPLFSHEQGGDLIYECPLCKKRKLPFHVLKTNSYHQLILKTCKCNQILYVV